MLNTGRLERQLVLATLACSVLTLVLTARLLQAMLPPSAMPARTVWEMYTHYLTSTRIITGAALVAGWPAILHFSARVLRLTFPRPGYFLTLAGILLGALTYGLSFLPWPPIAAVLVLPPLCALGLFIGVLRLPPRPAISFWLLQGALALGLACGTVWGLESLATQRLLNPLQELPAICNVALNPVLGEQQLAPVPPELKFPVLRWSSSGSKWLDYRANRALIQVDLPADARDWTLSYSMSDSGEPTATIRNEDLPATIPTFAPQPDTNYRLVLEPVDLRGAPAVVYSLLPVSRPDSEERHSR